MSEEKSVILVTGGSGLVGQAIKTVVEEEKASKRENSENETWVFCGSKDGDLRYVLIVRLLAGFIELKQIYVPYPRLSLTLVLVVISIFPF